MFQNRNCRQNHAADTGVGVPPDEILNLIDHTGGNYSTQCGLRAESKKNVVKGVPVAPGRAVGRAAVIETHEDLQRTSPESILVCSRMSADFSIVFQKTQGIISEQGGVTATGATVARETGLPAVAGVRSARRRIADGDLIRIDGITGHVEIISKAS